MIRAFLLFVSLCISFAAFAQQPSNPYKIRQPKWWWFDRCKQYKEVIKEFPSEVKLGVQLEGRTIYLIMPSKVHFDKLFDRKRDGIAVDVVHNDQYTCGQDPKVSGTWPAMGYLLPPMYKEALEKNLSYDPLKNLIVEYGTLPEQFNPEEVECNLLLLQKRALCDYNVSVDPGGDHFELLETGLYWDVLPEDHQTVKSSSLRKIKHFVVPFEKNKAEFKEEDIRPLYDLLRLTDYTIISVAVDAYSSVEGTLENNEKLQQQRAQSIVEALETIQALSVEAKVTTRENWDQFARDIRGTEFAFLRKYSKEKIKKKLEKDEKLLAALEPMLAKQRKAFVRLTLQQKEQLIEDPEKMVAEYRQSVAQKDHRKALDLQRKLFDKLKNEQLPDEYLHKLEVPKSSEYGPVFSNMLLFKLEQYDADLLQTIHEMEELQQLMPENPKVLYNLTALKQRAWTQGRALGFNQKSVGDHLAELNKMKVDPAMLYRLKINYNLLAIQYLTYDKKFDEVKKRINDVLYYYRQVDRNYDDLYRMARFLASNQEYDKAADLIYPVRLKEDLPEDLLFYYLKLTVYKEERVRRYLSDEVFEKAIALNQERFCKLFSPVGQGGYSFQIKSVKQMNEAYCEYCTETDAKSTAISNEEHAEEN